MDINTLQPGGPRVGKKEGERKRSGFLSGLLAKLGIGGNPAAGAAAAAVVRDGAIFGGLLATKAGLLALILAGTTVAAGVGIVGNQMGLFDGADFSRDGLPSIFDGFKGHSATAPQTPQPPSSLGYVAQANKGELADPNVISADQTQAPGAASASAPGVPDNANAPANINSRAGKMGAMKSFANGEASAGGSSASAASPRSAAGPNGPAVSGSSGGGPSSALRGAPKASVSSMRASVVGSRSALSQAMGARADAMRSLRSQGTLSSQAAGATYDGAGAARAASSIAPGGIAGGGAGAGGNGIDQGVPSNNPPAPNKVLPTPPPVGPSSNQTPWQWAMNIAIGAMVAAVALLLAANLFKGNLMARKVLAGMATAAGAVATGMGIVLMTTYKQMMEGGMFAAIGGIITVAAAKMLIDASSSTQAPGQITQQGATTTAQTGAKLSGTVSGTATPAATTPASGAGVTTTPPAGTGTTNGTDGILGNLFG